MISSHDNFEKPPWIHRIIKNIISACLIVHEFILCKPYWTTEPLIMSVLLPFTNAVLAILPA